MRIPMAHRIVIEKAKGNFSAYAPAFPGCVATGATEEETRRNMQAAILFHLEGCVVSRS
jgi:predicted RNase H-like HicB family nuclease